MVWRFSPEASDRARKFVFHPDQMLTENDDGTVTVSFSACDQQEMCWHFFNWRDKVEVIKPARRSTIADQSPQTVTAMR